MCEYVCVSNSLSMLFGVLIRHLVCFVVYLRQTQGMYEEAEHDLEDNKRR